MPVRVIRVLEYEYADHQAAERDMSCWSVPANGVRNPSGVRDRGPMIRSATTFPAMVSESIQPQEEPKS